jgi:hypothetical protein
MAEGQVTTHTANDFAPPDRAHDLATDYARIAARSAVNLQYVAAIACYRAAIANYRLSRLASAPERIRFAESEIARLTPLAKVGAP